MLYVAVKSQDLLKQKASGISSSLGRYVSRLSLIAVDHYGHQKKLVIQDKKIKYLCNNISFLKAIC